MARGEQCKSVKRDRAINGLPTITMTSQESTSGGRGAPRGDKEFFPAIAKAISRKSGAEGDLVGEKRGKARSERRAGEGSTIKGMPSCTFSSVLVLGSIFEITFRNSKR